MAEEVEKYTKYETARILGARALQISMGAPFLIKLTQKQLKVHYTVEGLQTLLKQMDEALKKKGHQGIALAFSGVNLRITGKLQDIKAWHQLVMDIYGEMVGKLVIDNRIVIPSP